MLDPPVLSSFPTEREWTSGNSPGLFPVDVMLFSAINLDVVNQWQIQTLIQGSAWFCFACPAGFSSFCDFFFFT